MKDLRTCLEDLKSWQEEDLAFFRELLDKPETIIRRGPELQRRLYARRRLRVHLEKLFSSLEPEDRHTLEPLVREIRERENQLKTLVEELKKKIELLLSRSSPSSQRLKALKSYLLHT